MRRLEVAIHLLWPLLPAADRWYSWLGGPADAQAHREEDQAEARPPNLARLRLGAGRRRPCRVVPGTRPRDERDGGRRRLREADPSASRDVEALRPRVQDLPGRHVRA